MTRRVPKQPPTGAKLLQHIPVIRDFDDEEPTRPLPHRTLDEIGEEWSAAHRSGR